MRVVFTKVEEEDRDASTDRSLQVALPVSIANEEFSDVIIFSDIRHIRIVLLKRVAADVALCRVFVFFPLLSAHSLPRSIGSELLEDRRFPLDEDAQEHKQRILSDLYHRQLIVSTEIRAENCCCGTHFVLLGLSCIMCLANERFEDRLEVCIDDKRRHAAKFVVGKFELSLF